MRKLICLTATLLMIGTAPAYANANKTEGRVTLSVRGSGLRVDRVIGSMDGHGTGVRAQLYEFAAGSTPYNVTGWKAASPQSWGMTKASVVEWVWKGGRTFPSGTRLCIVFNRAPGDNPCAVIHS
ncbi:hypothetical protein [Streptomyces sp. NPDC001205]